MLDMPEIVPIIVETYHQEGPFGAKGIGEPDAAPTAAAISSGIFDAVGIRIRELPITPEKVLAALRERGGKGCGFDAAGFQYTHAKGGEFDRLIT
jgi:CO/xanthine dehydrogenase Mo-binding subunit